MDVSSILTTMLSTSAISNIAKVTETEKSDVKNVITAAMPNLISSALTQSKDKSLVEGFTDALASHAGDSTSSLTSFFNKIDLKDGSKIVKNLFGDSASDIISKISEKAGTTKKSTTSILSSIAPLFMSLLGQSTSADKDSETTSSIAKSLTGLLKGANVTSLLSSLTGSLTGSDKKETTTTSGKKKTTSSTSTAKKKTTSKKSTISTIANIAGKLLK